MRLDMNTLELDPSYHSSHHTMRIHMLGQYKAKIVTYFSVFKLWFTLSTSASAVAPESPTLFPPRLWKRVFQNVCM